jgi:phosphate starvation-inducible protein PhoH and related proteins
MNKRTSARKGRQSDREQDQARRGPVQAWSATQKTYLAALQDPDTVAVVAFGPAGTGKTFVAASHAAHLYEMGAISKVIITRPAVEAGGEKHGFLPGSLQKKTEPWARPVVDVFRARLGAGKVKELMNPAQDGGPVIEFMPIAYMRGATLSDAFIIVDEAQNLSPAQMRMLMTRIGQNTKVAVAGDIDQSDLGVSSGLAVFLDVMRRSGSTLIKTVEFTVDDVVRSGFVRDVLVAYHAYDKANVVHYQQQRA